MKSFSSTKDIFEYYDNLSQEKEQKFYDLYSKNSCETLANLMTVVVKNVDNKIVNNLQKYDYVVLFSNYGKNWELGNKNCILLCSTQDSKKDEGKIESNVLSGWESEYVSASDIATKYFTLAIQDSKKDEGKIESNVLSGWETYLLTKKHWVQDSKKDGGKSESNVLEFNYWKTKCINFNKNDSKKSIYEYFSDILYKFSGTQESKEDGGKIEPNVWLDTFTSIIKNDNKSKYNFLEAQEYKEDGGESYKFLDNFLTFLEAQEYKEDGGKSEYKCLANWKTYIRTKNDSNRIFKIGKTFISNSPLIIKEELIALFNNQDNP